MTDITKCSPTKFKKKCYHCYRWTAKPSKWQNYANLSNPCLYLSNGRVTISIEEYNKKMSEIIATFSDRRIDEALIALLDEAGKYTIASDKPKLSKRKKGKL